MAEVRLGSLNVVILMGRAVADPELRYTPKGTPVLAFRIAVNRRYKDPTSGEWKDETSFFTVNQWGPGAERNAEVLKKGGAVLVEGRLRSRSYETTNGEKRTAVEIVAQRVQCLDRTVPTAAPAEGVAPPPVEEVEIPTDQVDDVPF
ncbi:MAG: single-stranded DNA-binding protein [candidate division WOR-3 bacterium]